MQMPKLKLEIATKDSKGRWLHSKCRTWHRPSSLHSTTRRKLHKLRPHNKTSPSHNLKPSNPNQMRMANLSSLNHKLNSNSKLCSSNNKQQQQQLCYRTSRELEIDSRGNV